MAQLKNTLVNGVLRITENVVTDTVTANGGILNLVGDTVNLTSSNITVGGNSKVLHEGIYGVLFHGITGGTITRNINNCGSLTVSGTSYYFTFTAPSEGTYLFLVSGSSTVSGVLCVNKQVLYIPQSEDSGHKALTLTKEQDANILIWPSGNVSSGLTSGITITVIKLNA